MKDNIIFYFLILNIFFIHIIICVEQKKEQTCEDKKDEINPNYEEDNDNFDDLINSEYFLKQPIITKENINTSNYNSSEYFDFSINKNILNFIRYNEAIQYPHERFKEKQQGNFLHFMHLAYEKNLPVYFSLDQMIYPYIELTKQLNFDIVEFAFYPIYKTFFNNIINYGIKNNYDNDIILYFIIGSKFLYENKEIEKNIEINQDNYIGIKNNYKYCEKFHKDLFSREENNTNTSNINYSSSIDLFGKKRIFNKINFLKVNKKFKEGNIISQKITNSIRFFQELIFDASDELYNIYLIGKIIDESGQTKTYFKIKKFIQYLFNEEEDNMNPVEIYKYINDNFQKIKKTKEEINKLFEKIKKDIIKPKYFNFLNFYYFLNKQQEMEYYEEKNKQINLFSYSTSIEDWANNKMINYPKGRIFPSILEFLDIAFDGKMGRKTLFERFEKKEIKDNFFIYRDGIDMKQELVRAKKLMEKSYKEERNKWINSYEYSFYYLLYIIGSNIKDTDRNGLIKSFNTILGSYVHFKKDILIIKQYSNFTYNENGNIPDIHFENNTKFYTELKAVTEKYKENIMNLTECLDNKQLKDKVIEVVNFKLNLLFKAIDNIITILTSNDKNKIKDIIDKIFFYNRRLRIYSGWYVDLYKNNKFETEYNLDLYAYNYFIANPINQINFKGAIIYEAMNYPEIGLIAVKDDKDKNNMKKKLYIFSSYLGNEYPHRYENKVDFKGMQEDILARKY